MSAPRATDRAAPASGLPETNANAEPIPSTTAPQNPLADAGILLSPEWIRDRGLPVGAPLETEELPDGALLLRPALESRRPTTFTVPAAPDRPSEHLFRELVAAYLGGATEFANVEPGGLRSETREVARTFAERTGVSPPSGDDEVLRLEDRTPGTSVPLSALLRQMYRAVREIQESAGAFLEGSRPSDPSRLSARDDDVDRQAWLVERTLVLRLDHDPSGRSDRWTRSDPISPILIARALERTADHAVVLGEHAARLGECSVPETVRASLRTFHRQALDFLDSAYAVTESPEVRRANELLDTGAALHATHRSLSESLLVRGPSSALSPLASADLGLVLQSIDRTVAYSEDLVEVGLDRAVAAHLARDLARPGGSETDPRPDGRRRGAGRKRSAPPP